MCGSDVSELGETRLAVLGTYGNVSFSLNFSDLSATSVMRVIDVAITRL
jgi:hypothetical protein